MTAAEQILPAGADRTQRAAWLTARRAGIGGSDVAPILGLSPTRRCARDVYLSKVEGGEQDPNEAMLWGSVFEAPIRDEWSRRTGITVTPTGMHRSRRWPIMLYSADGLTGDGGLYEGKVARRAEDWESDQLPDHAELQVQHGMAVMGLPHAWVVAVISGQKMEYRRVPRDEDLIEMLVRQEQAFWTRYVTTGTPPPLDGSEAAERWVKERYPLTDGSAVKLDQLQVERLRTAYVDASSRAGGSKAALVAAQNAIRDAMGSAEVALCGDDEVFTWKHHGSSFNEQAFRADHPELAEQYTVSTPVLDCKRLRREHPDLYAQPRYRNRVLRVKGV